MWVRIKKHFVAFYEKYFHLQILKSKKSQQNLQQLRLMEDQFPSR